MLIGSSFDSCEPVGITFRFGDPPKPGAEMMLSTADQQLLSLLRENARAPTAELARRLGLSRTTVQSRIERLERQAVITGYTVRVSDEAERGGVRAHIMIAVLPRQMTAVVRALHAMPEIRALHSVSGPFDLVAMAQVPSVAGMDELTDRIGAIEGVERTTSSIVLSAKFER